MMSISSANQSFEQEIDTLENDNEFLDAFLRCFPDDVLYARNHSIGVDTSDLDLLNNTQSSPIPLIKGVSVATDTGDLQGFQYFTKSTDTNIVTSQNQLSIVTPPLTPLEFGNKNSNGILMSTLPSNGSVTDSDTSVMALSVIEPNQRNLDIKVIEKVTINGTVAKNEEKGRSRPATRSQRLSLTPEVPLLIPRLKRRSRGNKNTQKRRFSPEVNLTRKRKIKRDVMTNDLKYLKVDSDISQSRLVSVSVESPQSEKKSGNEEKKIKKKLPTPYACDHCDRRFCRKSGHTLHVNTVHKGIHYGTAKQATSSDELKSLKLEFKPSRVRNYSISSCLNKKISGNQTKKTKKELPNLYSCDKCDKRYCMIRGLNLHVDIVHKGIRYRCDLCQFKTPMVPSMSVHFKKHHVGNVMNGNFTKTFGH